MRAAIVACLERDLAADREAEEPDQHLKVLHCAFGQALTHAEDEMPSHSKPLARLGRYPVAAERATGRKPRSYGRLTDPSTNPVGTTIVVASSTFLRRVIP